MSNYTPDRWQIIKIHLPKGTLHYRVICSWAGSYVYGSSWKISSGIETFIDLGDEYKSDQTSGSCYILRKNAEESSMLTETTFNRYHAELVAQYGEGNFTFEYIHSDDFLIEFDNSKK